MLHSASMPPMTDATLPLEITQEQLDLHDPDAPLLIDCRCVEEYEEQHIPGAMLVPLQHMSVRIDDLRYLQDRHIVIYCRVGNRSWAAAAYMRATGFPNCQSLAGGIDRWNGALE